jgi:hypothetical protein
MYGAPRAEFIRREVQGISTGEGKKKGQEMKSKLEK